MENETWCSKSTEGITYYEKSVNLVDLYRLDGLLMPLMVKTSINRKLISSLLFPKNLCIIELKICFALQKPLFDDTKLNLYTHFKSILEAGAQWVKKYIYYSTLKLKCIYLIKKDIAKFRFPGLSRTCIRIPWLSRPGKWFSEIPGLSRISSTCTNPAQIMLIKQAR